MKNLSVDYVDANIPIFSVHIGYGPFIIAFNKHLERYTIERSMVPPDSKYCSKGYQKKLFKGYMRSYVQRFGFQWIMDDWCVKYTDMLREGYNEGFKYFADYLTGNKLFCLKQLFDAHLWKNKLQKLIAFFYFKKHN